MIGVGDVAQLCLNTQQLVQTIQECQAAFVKLVAVFLPVPAREASPMPCSFSMVWTEEEKDSMR